MRNIFLILLPIFLIVLQIWITSQGFRKRGDRSWYRMSYEEKAARRVATVLKNQQTILIASFPEPYYFFTKHPTHSIADKPPYIFIPNAFDNREVVIIQDMGMHDIFPRFSKTLTETMQEFKQESFFINEHYHYGIRSEKEKYPVVIYQTTLKTLKEKISN